MIILTKARTSSSRGHSHHLRQKEGIHCAGHESTSLARATVSGEVSCTGFVGFDSSGGISLPGQLYGFAGGVTADRVLRPGLQPLPVLVIGWGATLPGDPPVWRTLTSEDVLAVLDDMFRRTAHVVLQVPVGSASSLPISSFPPDAFVLLLTHLHEALLELHLLLDVLAEALVHLVGAHESVHPLGPRGVAADGIGGLAIHHPVVGVLGVTVVLCPHYLTLGGAQEAQEDAEVHPENIIVSAMKMEWHYLKETK